MRRYLVAAAAAILLLVCTTYARLFLWSWSSSTSPLRDGSDKWVKRKRNSAKLPTNIATPHPTTRGLLVFDVCGGLTNQRIAILQGLMMGHLLNRTVVLPSLSSSYDRSKAHHVDFQVKSSFRRSFVNVLFVPRLPERVDTVLRRAATILTRNSSACLALL
jgi:hypothetical protein